MRVPGVTVGAPELTTPIWVDSKGLGHLFGIGVVEDGLATHPEVADIILLAEQNSFRPSEKISLIHIFTFSSPILFEKTDNFNDWLNGLQFRGYEARGGQDAECRMQGSRLGAQDAGCNVHDVNNGSFPYQAV
jgi:hypothetical protein